MKPLVAFQRSLPVALLAPLVFSVAFAGRPRGDRVQFAVNVDLTDEGRKVPRPTPDKPAYYVPVIFGSQESGKIVAGEQPPSREEVIRQVAQALARQGYVLQARRRSENST